jgi:hypothetical protein
VQHPKVPVSKYLKMSIRTCRVKDLGWTSGHHDNQIHLRPKHHVLFLLSFPCRVLIIKCTAILFQRCSHGKIQRARREGWILEACPAISSLLFVLALFNTNQQHSSLNQIISTIICHFLKLCFSYRHRSHAAVSVSSFPSVVSSTKVITRFHRC